MAEFRLERFKYNWKGDWTPGSAYRRDDIVRVNGKSYVCVITHVASAAFRTDLDAVLPGSNPPLPQPKWTVMTNGKQFVGQYSTGTDYNLGDLVFYQGTVYQCIINHNATDFATDKDNWGIFVDHINYLGDWQSGEVYANGAIVRYNGISYKCVFAHLSQTRLEDDIDHWEEYHVSKEYIGEWEPNTNYRKNDYVKYGGTLFRCIESHLSSTDSLDDQYFTTEIIGFQNAEEWSSTVYYNVGDIVRYGGFVYYALLNNFNSTPFVEATTDDWQLLSRGYRFRGQHSLTDSYLPGDIVQRGGNVYLSLREIGGGSGEIVIDPDSGEVISDTRSTYDGSSVDYLDDNTWELIIPGKSFTSTWAAGSEYKIGDIVYYRGTAYSCNFEHISSILNYPGDNGNVYDFWDILIPGGETGGLQKKGDLLTYGLSREIDADGSTVFDDSTVGSTRVAIGESEQLLSVSSELEVFWRNITEDADTVFVSTNGIDDVGRGSYQKPFKTIKYAAEYVEDNFAPLTPVIIRVSAGKFEEIAPIVVPAGCAINGDELRSTTVLASGPIDEYQNSLDYVNQYLNRFITIVLDLITGVEITPTEGNTARQYIAGDLIPFDPLTGEEVFPVTFPISNIDGANRIVGLVDDFRAYLDFRIGSGSTNPEITGSNTETLESPLLFAADALLINRDFIQQELLALLRVTYPQETFNSLQIKNDIASLLRGLYKDLKTAGNYKTLLSAQRYTNAVNGSQLSNLFYMRDTTGLRDMTTGGLQGTLNPPGVFDLYQKPTGGALVSLDPGYGPDDESTWIVNRSPYIQGVTNTGTSCVGMKVDGALHNGGNKSMTANDFTQVLSDGIGAWITNNGRAELVSVFTYYCQIGYFAEDGGIIRSTNGNNSYGNYGSIADGIDSTEIPQDATVFTRNNEAQVVETFAGGASDELKLFEYSNAGEEYTQANATISGAGNDAQVEFTDFRFGGLFETRLTSPDGSSNAGGTNYLVRQGSAQETLDASSSIVISATDPTQFLSEIEGMRIIITDGKGVGQYGYIDDFNFNNKTVTVRRDSDSNLGWDHIIPGTPLEASFDLTTRYRIEPRIIATAPLYSRVSYPLFTNRTYVDLQYGNYTRTYTGVTSGTTQFWKDDNDEKITVSEIISNIQVKVNAYFAANPNVTFVIEGRTSGTTATVNAIESNTGEEIELALAGNGTGFIVGEELNLNFASGSGESFADVAVSAVFSVTAKGRVYQVSLTDGGSGYAQGDKIVIPGTQLGGTSPTNDLTIEVTQSTNDSTNAIFQFTTEGTAATGRFVTITDSEYARYSDDGENWTEVSLPFVTSNQYKSLIAGDDKFIAIARNEDRIATSLNGVSWSSTNLPLAQGWVDGTFGNDKFVIIGDDTDIVLSSSNGTSWTQGYIPNDTVGDSTISQWSKITYGKGKYVAISINDRATATSTDGVSWTRNDSALPDFGASDHKDITYGRNRFVTLGTGGETGYSFDGVTWYTGDTLPTITGLWTRIKYANGVFFAIADANGAGTETNVIATSEDGILWTSRELGSAKQWTALTNGIIDGENKWVVLASAATSDAVELVSVGATARLRANVQIGSFQNIKIWDPGSGYTEDNLPVLTITDPNPTIEVAYESRIGDRVLSQPEFINRGAGYRRSSSIVTITGDGYADIIPESDTITLSGIENVPGPGVQIQIEGVLDPTSVVPGTLFTFSGVEVFDLGDDGSGNETRLVRFTISPKLETYLNVRHDTPVTLREKFSQCRISGHDFLDIGTGNFEETNYPELYAGGAFFTAAPENEVYEANQGRIFYVSTDQDGNFRTGELFSVQQATGIVTISAQFFDLDGLSELALGGVRLGGSGTVVNEFSTDPTFSADSNNVIPTQRAIATFLADRLSIGGESLEVNALQAGRVFLGGAENAIDNAADNYLFIGSDVSFTGNYEANDGEGNITTEQTNVSGTIITQSLLLKEFDETMQ